MNIVNEYGVSPIIGRYEKYRVQVVKQNSGC